MASDILHDFKYKYPETSILYVEDEKFSREKLLRVLNRRFAHIHVAIDGVEGFQLYQKYKPDIIIADIKMNQMSGLTMIKKIRELNDKVQVIVTTAHDDNDFYLQSIESNVNHFILKPIDLDLFLQAIQKSVYQIQLEKELDKQKKLTRSILDFQDNLIFVIENGEIVEWNQAFSNLIGLDQQNHPVFYKSKLLSNFFVEDPHYFYPKDKEKWIDEFFSIGKNVAKVRWKGPLGTDYNYVMKAASIPGTKQILFVCTDITELERESRKNEHLAMMDPLTNCFTRSKFKDLLTTEIRRAEQFGHPFSIIMMDIDHFTSINDRYGHSVADNVLVTISTIVQQRIRECDLFARWGGEEFMLITPETDQHSAIELAESIRSIIEEFQFKTIGRVTCSFGVAEFSKGVTRKDLLSEAEHALNQAKQNGRNHVILYSKEC